MKNRVKSSKNKRFVRKIEANQKDVEKFEGNE